ncbi:MAG: methionine--tRNA ligase [Candidatus Staskawiczbacteria bacterium]|nr:methionine--tRNA ligase [Candidatus Staskawiczbacteria bacterium]
MEVINFEDFKKLEIRIGKIISAEKVENSEKLLKLNVDFGSIVGGTSDVPPTTNNREIRQVIAGIAQYYEPEALIGKECPFAYNLAPRVLAGLESQGMILCASASLSTFGPSDASSQPVLLHPDKEIPPGALIK